MATIPLVRQAEPASEISWQAVSLGERLASALLFAMALPVLAPCALLVSVLSRRTPFIAHRRVGWRGADLWMVKLRTMWGDAAVSPSAGGWIEYIDDHQGPEQKQSGDPRVPNAFARFCRRHSIDELPQLWHVMRGEMSLVGPRPVTAAELDRYYGDDAVEILQVRPGIAGLWSVSGRNRLSYDERRRLDLQLVRRWSLRLYAQILVKTVPEVLNGSNSW